MRAEARYPVLSSFSSPLDSVNFQTIPKTCCREVSIIADDAAVPCEHPMKIRLQSQGSSFHPGIAKPRRQAAGSKKGRNQTAALLLWLEAATIHCFEFRRGVF